MVNTAQTTKSVAWKTVIFTALRIAVGLLWGLVALRFWSSDFAPHLQYHYHQAVLNSQPGVLIIWFGIWTGIMSTSAAFFAAFGRIVAAIIAFGLLAGFARRTVYILAILACIPVWTLAEGYLPPHSLQSFGLSSVVIYILLFIVLMAADKLRIRQWFSMDNVLLAKWPGWHWLAGFGGQPAEPAGVADGGNGFVQRTFAGLLAVVLAVLISAAANSWHLGHPASPDPLMISDMKPLASARDALLPPLLGTGDTVEVRIEASSSEVQIASGITFQAKTFNGMVPAPTLHVRQGQTVKVIFTNKDKLMPHSIDFHSAKIAPNRAFANARFGETVEFSFKAEVPGAFVYHCSTNPMMLHLAAGMYGAIIIDPAEPLPPAAVEYVLVQSELHTQRFSGTTMGPDYEKMITDRPDLVVFNGVAFQYHEHPLPAKVGELVRIYLVNAGPNRWSSFHVIGGIFDRVYPAGNFQDVLRDVSTYSVGPGQGSIFDIVFTEPGTYAFVDHSVKNMTVGAEGVFRVD